MTSYRVNIRADEGNTVIKATQISIENRIPMSQHIDSETRIVTCSFVVPNMGWVKGLLTDFSRCRIEVIPEERPR